MLLIRHTHFLTAECNSEHTNPRHAMLFNVHCLRLFHCAMMRFVVGVVTMLSTRK